MAVIITPGNAVPGDVRADKRFNAGANYNAAGTLVDRTGSGLVIAPSNVDQAIPAGAYDGAATDGKVAAVTFDASKLLEGTTIANTAGAMPNRAGDTAALSATTSGTTLKLRASNGYRDGINDYVTHTDANRVAGNIKKDVVLDGITGTHNDVEVLEAGDNLLVSGQNPIHSVIATSVTTMYKCAEVKINRAGYVRTTFSLSTSYATGGSAYGQIYKNGQSVGTLRSNNTTTYLSYTEDIAVAAGDRIQLYMMTSNNTYAAQCHIFYVKSALPSNVAEYVYIANAGV